jgi:hypothetical protein
MSNNIFNIRAEEAGREFARANPNASGVDIDDAATKHDPCDPGRRHFQMAAYDLLNRMRSKTFYRWSVRCRTGHCSGGMAHDIAEAHACIKDVSELYHEQGRMVTSYTIFNQDDAAIVEMDRT